MIPIWCDTKILSITQFQFFNENLVISYTLYIVYPCFDPRWFKFLMHCNSISHLIQWRWLSNLFYPDEYSYNHQKYENIIRLENLW